MTTISVVSYRLLEAQLQLLEDQVARTAADLKSKCNMPGKPDTDDLIALALETLERIRKRCTAEKGGAMSRALLGYWQRWHATARGVLPCIEQLEALGFPSERATEFRFALNEASIATDWDKVVIAIERINTGRRRSLEEIENDLSHQPG